MASVDSTIEIRLEPDSLAAIHALTEQVARLADELERSRRDDEDDVDDPTDIIPEKSQPAVSVWRT